MIKKLFTKIWQSEICFWHWKCIFSISDDIDINNNYCIYQHKYTKRKIKIHDFLNE